MARVVNRGGKLQVEKPLVPHIVQYLHERERTVAPDGSSVVVEKLQRVWVDAEPLGGCRCKLLVVHLFSQCQREPRIRRAGLVKEGDVDI